MLLNRPGRYSEILQGGGFEIVYPPTDADRRDPATLLRMLDGVDAILASVEPLSRDILSQSNLRVVARSGVGYDSVDVTAATELGIVVTIAPGEVEKSAAEHTIALLLCLTRGLIERDQNARAGRWIVRARPRIAGNTLGIVGLGRIGKEVATRAIGLGMEVVAFDPLPDQEFAARHGVTLCSFDELLATADVVSLHLPTTPETADIINAGALRKMKKGAIFVNTSRGATVDEDALCDALASGHLFGAALDVFKREPLPLDSPLLKLENVVLCTHLGGLDEVSEVAMPATAAQCIVDLHEGRWPDKCVVNKELRDGWSW